MTPFKPIPNMRSGEFITCLCKWELSKAEREQILYFRDMHTAYGALLGGNPDELTAQKLIFWILSCINLRLGGLRLVITSMCAAHVQHLIKDDAILRALTECHLYNVGLVSEADRRNVAAVMTTRHVHLVNKRTATSAAELAAVCACNMHPCAVKETAKAAIKAQVRAADNLDATPEDAAFARLNAELAACSYQLRILRTIGNIFQDEELS